MARYLTVITGNQAGKTILGREILKYIAVTFGGSGNCSIVLSSDYKAIKRNIIDPILAEWGNLIVSYDKNYHVMTLANGHQIHYFSSENVKSIEGATNAIFAWIDEGSDVSEEAYHRIRIRLMTARGRRLITATPIIGIGVKQLEDEYKKGINPKHCSDDVPFNNRHLSFCWSSADNPYLSLEELEDLAADISNQAEVQIRLHGKFENLGGRVFDGNLLNAQWMGYTHEDIKDMQLVHYGFIDTASGQTQNEKNDDTALVIVGIAPEYGIYCRECISGKFSVDEINKYIIDKSRQYKITKWGIEAIAAQINYALSAFQKGQSIRDHYVFVPLRRIGGNNAKPARHARLIPYHTRGVLKFPVDPYGNFINGFDKMIDQMRDTPYGRHDDCIDALCDVANPEMGILQGFRKHEKREDKPLEDVVMTKREFVKMKQGDTARSMSYN